MPNCRDEIRKMFLGCTKDTGWSLDYQGVFLIFLNVHSAIFIVTGSLRLDVGCQSFVIDVVEVRGCNTSAVKSRT